MFAHYDILEIFVNSSRFVENVEMSCFFLCVPSVIMIFYEIMRNTTSKKILGIYNIFIGIVFFIILLLCNASVFTYKEVINIIQIIKV